MPLQGSVVRESDCWQYLTGLCTCTHDECHIVLADQRGHQQRPERNPPVCRVDHPIRRPGPTYAPSRNGYFKRDIAKTSDDHVVLQCELDVVVIQTRRVNASELLSEQCLVLRQNVVGPVDAPKELAE